jgi:hypothetical protein
MSYIRKPILRVDGVSAFLVAVMIAYEASLMAAITSSRTSAVR